MSNIEQQNGQDKPTIVHVLFFGALGGVAIGSLFSVYTDIFFLRLRFGLVAAIAAAIGAGIGISFPKNNSNKWKGLFIGAVLGPLLVFFLLFRFYW